MDHNIFEDGVLISVMLAMVIDNRGQCVLLLYSLRVECVVILKIFLRATNKHDFATMTLRATNNMGGRKVQSSN